MTKILVAIFAFFGSFSVCYVSFPWTHNSPFNIGGFQPSWAFIIAFVVFCIAMRSSGKSEFR
jgi:hypothetical protein